MGSCAAENWLCVSLCMCGRYAQKSWQKVRCRQVKAFPACYESLSSTEELMLNLKKEKNGDRQNVLSVFKITYKKEKKKK